LSISPFEETDDGAHDASTARVRAKSWRRADGNQLRKLVLGVTFNSRIEAIAQTLLRIFGIAGHYCIATL
jgi:hypothetical protein